MSFLDRVDHSSNVDHLSNVDHDLNVDHVYIAFSDDDDRWYSRFLKSGYKHCSIIKISNDQYITLSKETTAVVLTCDISYDQSSLHLYTKLIKVSNQGQKRGLFMLNTCVGLVKQYLSISNPFIFTPYQIYKFLIKGDKNGNRS